MPNFYTKTTTVVKSKKKNIGLKDSSLDFILKYSSSIEVQIGLKQTIILSNN